MNIINASDSLFLIIDVQDKLVNMLNDNQIKENAIKLAKIGEILNIPAVITEQYPKGLGETIPEIKSAINSAKYFEKTSFSILNDEDIKKYIKTLNKKQIIMFGIETHICVLQSAIDLLNEGYEVFIVKSASGSRKDDDKETALRRLMHFGAQIVTTEMTAFELLKSSKHPNFKEVQSLIK